MVDIHELENRVANHLAGRPVIVRWQEPQSKTAAGQTYKTMGGAVIDVTPYLTGSSARLAVFLHELAHARLDWDILPFLDAKITPASVVTNQAARQDWRSNWREKRAQEQTRIWSDYAARQAWRYYRVDRDLMTCKLLALLDWQGG